MKKLRNQADDASFIAKSIAEGHAIAIAALWRSQKTYVTDFRFSKGF